MLYNVKQTLNWGILPLTAVYIGWRKTPNLFLAAKETCDLPSAHYITLNKHCSHCISSGIDSFIVSATGVLIMLHVICLYI